MLSRSLASSSRQRTRCLDTSRCLYSSIPSHLASVSPHTASLPTRSLLLPRSTPPSRHLSSTPRRLGLINKETFVAPHLIPKPVWTPASPLPPPIAAIDAPLSPTKAHLVLTAPPNPDNFIPLKPSIPLRHMETVDSFLPPYKRLPKLAWAYMKFLWVGCKETWAERKARSLLLDRIQDGETELTWRESRFERRVKSDLIKMVPFVLVACTLEELIPLIIYAFPSALPSTTLLPSQVQKIAERKEANLLKARSAIFEILQNPPPKPEGTAASGFELGWNSTAWLDWSKSDQMSFLQVYGQMRGINRTQNWLEGRMNKLIEQLANEDELLMRFPPEGGLTREEFLTILSDRGLLVNSLPSPALPLLLHDYLQARRTQPRFHPFAYTLSDIARNQPRLVEAAQTLLATNLANAPKSLITSDPNAPWTEKLSDWWEENVGARMDGRPNKINLVELAERERAKAEKGGKEGVGGGVEVKVLEEGKEGEGRVLRSPFESNAKAAGEGARMIQAAPQEGKGGAVGGIKQKDTGRVEV